MSLEKKCNEGLSVKVNGLTKRFSDKNAVDRVSFNVGFGEVYGLLRPNGAGKLTLISMIASVIVLEAGLMEVAHYIKELLELP